MMMRNGKRPGLALRMICALALLSIGFAQEAQAGNRTVSAAELAQYVLPDGTLPGLCITIPDGSGSGKIVRLGSDTLGAHHVQALVLPDHDNGSRLLAAGLRLLPVRNVILSLDLHPSGHGPRGPPSSLSMI